MLFLRLLRRYMKLKKENRGLNALIERNFETEKEMMERIIFLRKKLAERSHKVNLEHINYLRDTYEERIGKLTVQLRKQEVQMKMMQRTYEQAMKRSSSSLTIESL